MSQENVTVVRRMYEAFQRGDAEGAAGHFTPDVTVDASARPDVAVGTGRGALSRIVGEWVAAFDEWSEQIEEIRDVGDHVLVSAIQRGRGKASGVETENRYAVLYRLEDGRISAMTLYSDAAAALEAVGRRE